MKPPSTDPDERRLHRAIEHEDLVDYTARLRSPRGLRGLFPTNQVRINMRRIRSTDMPKKPLQDEPQATGPLDRPHGENDAVQRPARDERDETQREGRDTAQEQVLREPVQKPEAVVRAQAQAAQQDPGPAPEKPVYRGDMTPGEVDMITMGMEANDIDAVRAIKTMGLPPDVAQYKANVIDYLERHAVYKSLPKGQGDADEQQQADDMQQFGTKGEEH